MNILSACRCCLVWVFVFLPQTQTQFRRKNIDWEHVKDNAVWTSGLLEGNKELVQTAPKLYQFIKSLATNAQIFGTKLNSAYTAATVDFIGLIAASYYYSIEAQQHLQKAHFTKDGLEMIINTEIKPILALLERLYSKGDMAKFCLGKNEIQNLFRNALTSLQTVRKNIEQQMSDSASEAEKEEVLQWLSVVGVVGSTVAIATTPCMTTGFLACPQAIAGSSTMVSSIWKLFSFGKDKKTYDETMTLLNTTSLVALWAETTLRKARTKAEILCIENPTFPGNQLESVDIYKPKPATFSIIFFLYYFLLFVFLFYMNPFF